MKCNTAQSKSCKFVKQRLICNKCRFESRVNEKYKIYFKEYYQKRILEQEAHNYN